MNVKFKKLLPGAALPKKATDGSAAYDLYVPEDTIIKPGRHIIPLGFAMEMEPGYEALVNPRSGFSSKGMEGYRIITPSAFSSHIVWDPARGLSPHRPQLCQHDLRRRSRGRAGLRGQAQS